MIDPNQGTSPEALDKLREESLERTRIQILQAVEKQLEDYQMTWDDMASLLGWHRWDGDDYNNSLLSPLTGSGIKKVVGDGPLELFDLNQIAAVFSAEVYVIFRPRYPWVPKR